MTPRAFLLAGFLAFAVAGDTPDALFRDTFCGNLGDGWSWIRETPADWRVSDKGLEVCIRPGNMWGPANDAHNLLVRSAPDDRDLEITAAVSNHPTHQYEQVDLVWYFDDGHMVKVGHELVDGKLSVVMGREENDKTRTISITHIEADMLQLRLHITENKVEGFFKTPDADWRRVGECTPPGNQKPKISLMFYQGAADAPHWARVSDFAIRRVSKSGTR
jgi:regulation of enolase protein 1 (concanavalin A-like superfamily)